MRMHYEQQILLKLYKNPPELGTKQGSKGPYPQAREFDETGKPVRDIDFTDHGRPQNHPIPHQHEWKPNPTGGTPKREKEGNPL